MTRKRKIEDSLQLVLNILRQLSENKNADWDADKVDGCGQILSHFYGKTS